MKLSCTQENLAKGLQIVNHLASRNTSLPILNNVLMEAEEGALKLTTTNLEIGIKCLVRGKIEARGSFTVQAKLLSDYVSLLPTDKVDMELSENQLNIKCQNFKTKVRGVAAEEFPLIPSFDKKHAAQVKIPDFKKALSQVIFAVASDETRPEISGVYFSFKGGKLTMAATDSYRLAEKVIGLVSAPEGELSIIVPSRTLVELGRVLQDGLDDNLLEISLSDNQILFTFDSVTIVSRLIEGQYPNYQDVIPNKFRTEAVLPTQQFVKLVKTASLFCRAGINDVTVKLLENPKEIEVFSANSQLGENVSRAAAEIEGQANDIVFNFRYLLDGLANIDKDEVELKLIDANSPGVLRAKGGSDYTYIIMPIKQ